MMSDSRQTAVIVQHPRAPKPVLSPVCDVAGRVVAPAQEGPADRPNGPWDDNYALTEDICTPCQRPVRHHFTVGGRFIGCEGAQKLPRPPRNPERWNDPHTAVTLAVRRAMHEQCGPALDIFLAGFTHDEVMTMAHALSRAAIAEYTKGLGQ